MTSPENRREALGALLDDDKDAYHLAWAEKMASYYPHHALAVLRNWVSVDPWNVLYGDVEGHPIHGTRGGMKTSRLILLNEPAGIAVTQNTIYILKDKV